jgi:integrase
MWHVHGTYLGVPVRQSTGETDRDRAEAERARLVLEIRKACDSGRKPDLTPSYMRAHGKPPEPIAPPRSTAQPTGVAYAHQSYQLPAVRRRLDSGPIHPEPASAPTGGNDEHAGRRALGRAQSGLRPKERGPQPNRRTFWEACDWYATGGVEHAFMRRKERSSAAVALAKKYRRLLAPDVYCDDIDDDFLGEIGEEVLMSDSSSATFQRQVITPIRAILVAAHAKWGTAQGCPLPGFRTVPQSSGRQVAVPPHDAERMIALANAWGWDCVAVVLQVGFCEGPRRSEMFKLRWEFVDLDRRFLSLRGNKSVAGQVRDRNITNLRPRTVSALRAYREKTRAVSGPVFLRLDGEVYGTLGHFGRDMNGAIAMIARALELPYTVTLHVLRHSAATLQHVSGDDIELVRRRMDWKDYRTTGRYIHDELLGGSTPDEVFAFWGFGTKSTQEKRSRRI